jgi:L-amino acid N-acyltransferase YncA
MMPDQIKNYRNIVTLKDGAKVLFRAMVPDDEQGLVELFSTVSDDDLWYFRDNVRDPAVIHEWCEMLDYHRVLPLLAIVRNNVVGQATLHMRRGPKRHLGEVRIFLAKDFRQRGLGSKMLNTLIDLARKQNLQILTAEIVTDQSRVIKAFQKLGFVMRCTFEDYFMLPDGDTRDVAVLMLSLRQKLDEF